MLGKCVGFTKKEQVNVSGLETNARDLVGLDSFKIHGAVLFERVDNSTGEVQGAFAIKTDAGVFVGIAKNVYNAVSSLLQVYGVKEFTKGIDAKMLSSEIDSDRAYLRLEIL